MDATVNAELPPHPTDAVISRLEGLGHSSVGQLLHRFPDLVDSMDRSGLHLLEGSWVDGAENELTALPFEIEPDSRLVGALHPALALRVLETIHEARRRGVLAEGTLDMGRLALVGEVGYAVARTLAAHLVEIEPPQGGEAVGWTVPLPVIGWLGAGEGGSWYFGVDGTRLESGDWDGARAAAESWIAKAGGGADGSLPSHLA